MTPRRHPLIVIRFYNTGLQSAYTWVTDCRDKAVDLLAELNALDHITGIEVHYPMWKS